MMLSTVFTTATATAGEATAGAAGRGRRRARVVVLQVVVLLVVAVLAAGSGSAPAYATQVMAPDGPVRMPWGPLAQTGSVVGRVTDAGGAHRGLAQVAVRVFSSTTGSSATATTSADGRYLVSGLAVGTDYTVCFDGETATGGSRDGVGYVAACHRDRLAMVSVEPAGRTRVDASLTGGGVVAGTVREAAGGRRPLAGARVSVSGTGVSGADRQPVVTGADGTYRLPGLAAGTDYVVCFAGQTATGGSSDALGYGSQCFDRRPEVVTSTRVTVIPGRVRSGVDGLLVAGGAISGRVTDSGVGSHGLEGVAVQVSAASALAFGIAPVTGAVTAADGQWSVRGLMPGADYRVCFVARGAHGGSADARGYVDLCYAHATGVTTATPVRVVAGRTTTGASVALGHAGAIAGRVTEQGGSRNGLAGVRVTASAPRRAGVVVTTDSTGNYVVTGLAPGAGYQVCFTTEGAVGGSDALGYVGECYDNRAAGGATPVTVAADATRAGTDAALGAAGAISGTVTDLSPTRAGLANVTVSTYSAATRSSSFVITSSDGSYRLTGLAPGPDYIVCFAAGATVTGGVSGASGYVGECFDDRTGSQAPQSVRVVALATTARTDASLAPAGAIAGRVTDASAAALPLAGVQVAVTSAAHGFGSTRTRSDGTWVVPALPPGGDYTVCFGAASGATGGSTDTFGYVNQCFAGGSGTASVTVNGQATTTGVDARLAAAGGISGRVTDAAGAHHPLAGVLVQAYSGPASAFGWTAPDGTYRLTGLPPARDYRVSFDGGVGVTGGSADARGYRLEWYDNAPGAATATLVAVAGARSRAGADAALTPTP